MKRFFAFIAAILLTGILQTRCYAGCNCDDWMEQGGYCVDYIKARIPAFPFPFTTTEIEALKNKNISDVTDGDVAVFELKNYWHVAYIEKVHRDEHGVASAIDVSEMNYGNHPSFAEFKMKWGQKNRSEWHMGLAMEAAAEAHVPFIVLDRPNPLGGEYVSGPVLEKEQISFTGEYPIPVAHGMTIGELALMIKGEKMLPGLDNLDLHVIRIAGWQRNMEWPETELPWIRTSPNIPDFETALLYPGIGLFEGTSVSVGRGTSDPFKVIGFPGIDTDVLAKALNSKKLPGVRFEKTTFTPLSIPGMSSSPAYKGKEIAGIRITVSDPETFQSVETGVQILSALYSSLGDMDRRQFFKKSGFDHLAGTTALRLAIEKGLLPEDIINSWQKKNELYLEKRDKYLLY